MSRFTILLGGDLVRTPLLDRQVSGSRVIAADSGIRHAARLGVTPELWAGDFDSVTPEMRAAYPNIPVEEFPADKDLTDGEIAIEAALERGASELVLAGAFGGPRADHAYLHLAAAFSLAERGIGTLLTSGHQEGTPLMQGEAEFFYEPGTLFSIIGFSALDGLSLTGVKWPLDDRHVPFGSSLTISNQIETRLRITLKRGRALLIAHPFPEEKA